MSDLVRLLSVANEAVSAAFVVGLKRRAAVSSFLYPTLPTLPTMASFRSHERARERVRAALEEHATSSSAALKQVACHSAVTEERESRRVCERERESVCESALT